MSRDLFCLFAGNGWHPVPVLAGLVAGVGFIEHGFANLAKGPDALSKIV